MRFNVLRKLGLSSCRMMYFSSLFLALHILVSGNELCWPPYRNVTVGNREWVSNLTRSGNYTKMCIFVMFLLDYIMICCKIAARRKVFMWSVLISKPTPLKNVVCTSLYHRIPDRCTQGLEGISGRGTIGLPRRAIGMC